MDSTDLAEVRRTLWAAADELRANSALAPNEYRGPALGLISSPTPSTASSRFARTKATVRRPVTPDDYRARSVLFISEEARLSHLVNLPESEDLGAAVDAAMRLVETHNTELKDVLPKAYQRLEKSTLVELLRLFAPLPRKLSGDAFGLIYEDFLSNFAKAEVDWAGSSSPRTRSCGSSWRSSSHSMAGRSTPRADPAACSCSAPSSSSDMLLDTLAYAA